MRGSAVKRLRPWAARRAVRAAARRPVPARTRLPSSAAIRALALGGGARLPRRIVDVGPGAAIDMQPVLDGEVLEVAQPGVDLAQRLVGVEVGGDASLAGEPGALRGLDDEPRQKLAPPPVEPVGDGIFVDQPLELLRRARKLGVRRAAAADGRW